MTQRDSTEVEERPTGAEQQVSFRHYPSASSPTHQKSSTEPQGQGDDSAGKPGSNQPFNSQCRSRAPTARSCPLTSLGLYGMHAHTNTIKDTWLSQIQTSFTIMTFLSIPEIHPNRWPGLFSLPMGGCSPGSPHFRDKVPQFKKKNSVSMVHLCVCIGIYVHGICVCMVCMLYAYVCRHMCIWHKHVCTWSRSVH